MSIVTDFDANGATLAICNVCCCEEGGTTSSKRIKDCRVGMPLCLGNVAQCEGGYGTKRCGGDANPCFWRVNGCLFVKNSKLLRVMM